MSGRIKQPAGGVPLPTVPKPPVSRGGISGQPPPPSPYDTAPLPNLIINQPLPNPTTPQYQDAQAIYAQMLAQLQASQAQQLGLQGQINRLSATDPTAGLMQRLQAMYSGGDPFAAQRAAMAQQMAIPQRLSQAFMGAGY